MIHKGLTPSIVCFNTMLNSCIQCGDCTRAVRWFQEALKMGVEVNRISFSSMIDVHAQAGDWNTAEYYLQEMIRYGFHPDKFTCNSLLNAVSRDEAGLQGK